jgi:hypothetical protein
MALTVPSATLAVTYSYSRGNQFDMMTVNNTKFAIFKKPLQNSDQSQDLTLAADCHCVFLASMEAEHDITITAVNILALGSFHAKTGTIHIQAENFYGLGIEATGDMFIQTDGDTIVSSTTDDKLYVDAGGFIELGLTAQMRDIAIEIKTIFSQGIDDTNGLQFAQILLTGMHI